MKRITKLFMAAIMLMTAVVFTGCHKDPQNGGDDNGGNGGGNGGGGDTPTETSYTVTFNANGGTGTMQPQTFTKGETKALMANAFTYEYYAFVNWNTLADGSGTAYYDQQELTLTENLSLFAQWKPLKGELNGHEWVDLGLPSGTLWATCNVGANLPEDNGVYYGWGETASHNYYGWQLYKYANGSLEKLTKYCNNSSYGDNGFTDTLTVLLPEDDAATSNWGSGWRMPTKVELLELKNKCTKTWTTQNGVDGCLFTGLNGNSIFLPAARCRWGLGFYSDDSEGYYWSSSLDTDKPFAAWFLNLYSGSHYAGCYIGSVGYHRCFGFSVRPVCSVSQK